MGVFTPFLLPCPFVILPPADVKADEEHVVAAKQEEVVVAVTTSVGVVGDGSCC